MGRASGTSAAQATGTPAAARRGIDPRRLLSTSDPLASSLRLHGECAEQCMSITRPADGPGFLAAQGRIGFTQPYYAAGHHALREANFIISGATTRKHTGAAYRAHLAVVPAQGATGSGHEFMAVCTYGKHDGEQVNVVYRGTDIDAALKKLNAQMQSKVREGARSQYLPDSGDPQDAKVTREQFEAAWLARDPAFGGTPA